MHTTGFWNTPVRPRSPPISTAPAPWQLWQIFQSYSRHNKEPHKSSVETVGSVLTTAVHNSPLPAVPCPASITIFFLTFQEHPSITFTLSVSPHNSSVMQYLPTRFFIYKSFLPCSVYFYNMFSPFLEFSEW